MCIRDRGGVSPVTPDHVNPEAPWPHLESLRDHTAECGKVLTERLAVYPAHALDSARWQSPEMAIAVIRSIDGDGFASLRIAPRALPSLGPLEAAKPRNRHLAAAGELLGHDPREGLQ